MRTATGSALIACGETRVICTASVAGRRAALDGRQRQGWLTAEYGMLPASTASASSATRRAGAPTAGRSRSSA